MAEQPPPQSIDGSRSQRVFTAKQGLGESRGEVGGFSAKKNKRLCARPGHLWSTGDGVGPARLSGMDETVMALAFRRVRAGPQRSLRRLKKRLGGMRSNWMRASM